ncbi:MAG: heme exporter protein CcmD [Gammaproteobacteria bacterium]|jgi:heme exporter protein D
MFDRIQFSSFGEFLSMGGYAFNVWSVYLLFFVFLLVNLLGPLRRRKQILKELQRRAVLSERQQPAAND